MRIDHRCQQMKNIVKITQFLHAGLFPRKLLQARRKRRHGPKHCIVIASSELILNIEYILYIYKGGVKNNNQMYHRNRARIYSSADWSIHHSVCVLIILMSFFRAVFISFITSCAERPRRYTKKICSLS